MSDRSEPVQRSMTAASVRAQRGLSGFLCASGIWIMFAAGGHNGAARGSLLGFGASGVVLGCVLLWASIVTSAHLAEPPAYWQSLQDRWRSRFLYAAAIAGSTLLLVGGMASAGGLHGLGAGLAAFGAVFAAVAVALVCGGIRPIRYE